MSRTHIIFIALAFSMLALPISSQSFKANTPIVMVAKIIKSDGMYGDVKKTAVPHTTIYVNSNVLSFAYNCIGGTLQILSGEEVIYSTVIDESCKVELPEYINGTVELRLTIGDITFSAETEILSYIY